MSKITDVGAAYDPQFERVDTPRTDTLIYRKNTIEMQRHELLDLALALERELAEAVEKERERCAKVCDEMDESFVTIYGTDYTDFQNDPRYLQMAADAIRKGE
jgi:hypothetical protein